MKRNCSHPPGAKVPLVGPLLVPAGSLPVLHALVPKCRLRFVFFLGAQGKEYIWDIWHMFPQNTGVLFVLSSLDEWEFSDASVRFTTSSQCKQLTADFGVVDPLGGGLYPLDYLAVMDGDMVRARLPIRFAGWLRGHDRFGVGYAELEALIGEFLLFFAVPRTRALEGLDVPMYLCNV